MRFTKLCLNAVLNANAKKLYQSKIGLEIHARIKSKTKIFSDASAASIQNVPPNTNVALFDCALPGTMPTLNKSCVIAALLTACSLNCKINAISYFERKHYFYPDLPAGYQITQQSKPIAFDGLVEYPIMDLRGRISKKAKIRRIQLEHDTARTIVLDEADGSISLIDLNRCGLGLMEIVTEPDFVDASDTSSFIRELTHILKALGTCEVDMRDGGFRVDVNVSVHEIDSSTNNLKPSGRVELKNLNTINSVKKAIQYEIKRQIDEKNNNNEIKLHTRTFDTTAEKTVQIREKEDYFDYRFMPEPNLPPLFVFSNEKNHKMLAIDDAEEYQEYVEKYAHTDRSSEFCINYDEIENTRKNIIIPSDYRKILKENYLLTDEHAYLVQSNQLNTLFIEMANKNKESLNTDLAKVYSEVLTVLYLGALKRNKELEKVLTTDKLADFGNLIYKKVLNQRLTSVVYELMLKPENFSKMPTEIVNEKKLFVCYDKEKIANAISAVFKANDKSLLEYRLKPKKREKIFSFFIRVTQIELNETGDQDTLESLLKKALDDAVK